VVTESILLSLVENLRMNCFAPKCSPGKIAVSLQRGKDIDRLRSLLHTKVHGTELEHNMRVLISGDLHSEELHAEINY